MESAESMPFSDALEKLKYGQRVARAGWNGKGMFVWLEKGSSAVEVADRNRDTINGVGAEHFDPGPEGSITRMPHLCMRAADGSTVTGWLASQTDMLAEDWTVLPG